jgi:hypothetical protein
LRQPGKDAMAPENFDAGPARRHFHLVLVIAVFVAAALLQVASIPTDDPFLTNIDEPFFVRPAVAMVTTGDLNPHWFGHPGSFTIYMLAAAYRAYAALNGIATDAIGALYAYDIEPFHRIAKYMIVAGSLAAMLMTYLIARRLCGKWPALFAPVILSLTPLHYDYATQIRSDMHQVALILLCIYLCLDIVGSGRWRDFVAAGAALGVAVTAKWPSVVLGATLTLAAAVHYRDQLRTARPYLLVLSAAATSLVAAFLFSPFIFLDFGQVLANLVAETRHQHAGATATGFVDSYLRYVGLLGLNYGAAAMLLASLGLAYLGWRRPRATLVVISFPLLYAGFLSLQYLWWTRWALPLLPFVAIFAAAALAALLHLLRQLQHRALIGASYAALTVSAALYTAAAGSDLLSNRGREDPRITAMNWIIRNVPAGSRVFVEYSAPYLPQGLYEIYDADDNGVVRKAEQNAKFYIPTGTMEKMRDVAGAVTVGDYLVVGNLEDRLKREPEVYGDVLTRYNALFATYEKIWFDDSGIKVFRRKP